MFFSILSFFAVAQKTKYYTFPNKIPKEYKYNSKQHYTKLFNKTLKEKAGSKVKERDIERYAELMAYSKQDFVNTGKVYLNWVELEKYLNDILQQIAPSKYKNKVHVYPTRSAAYNAYAIHDGTFYFNIGLLADIRNEAAIATIMGHELAHYINEDSKNSFFRNLKTYTKRNRNKEALKIVSAHKNRAEEHKADSMGYRFARKGGYNVGYGLSNFYLFLDQELKNKDKSASDEGGDESDSKSNTLAELLASHPGTKSRIDYLKKNLRKFKINGSYGKSNLKGKKRFYVLQRKARVETLNLLLSSNNYKLCAERAFTYHLYEPTNKTYIYYIVESLRRLLYLQPGKKGDGFLTDDYAANFDEGKGILNNLEFLIRDKAQQKRVKAFPFKFSGKVPFNTYKQAFYYFAKKAIKLKIPEAYLSIAIYYTGDEKKANYRKKILRKYIGYSKAQHKEYAKALYKDLLREELTQNKKQIFVLSHINFLEDHYYGMHNRLILAEQENPEYIAALDEMLDRYYSKKEFIDVNSLREKNFNDYINYVRIIGTSAYFHSAKKGKLEGSETDDLKVEIDDKNIEISKKDRDIDIFILAPEIWEFYKNNNMRSLELMYALSYDDKTSIVKAVANTLFYPLLLVFGGADLSMSSSRYAYAHIYYKFDIKDQKVEADVKITPYKMTKAHFINTAYHILNPKNKKKE